MILNDFKYFESGCCHQIPPKIEFGAVECPRRPQLVPGVPTYFPDITTPQQNIFRVYPAPKTSNLPRKTTKSAGFAYRKIGTRFGTCTVHFWRDFECPVRRKHPSDRSCEFWGAFAALWARFVTGRKSEEPCQPPPRLRITLLKRSHD